MEFPLLSHKAAKLRVCPHGGMGDRLFTVPGLLSVLEAQSCLDYAEFLSFQPSTSRGPAYGEAFRDNGRVSIHDPAIAAALWHDTGLAGLLGTKLRMGGKRPLGCNPNIRFYRYTAGQRFGRHVDDSVELGPGQCTGYTLLVYLSGMPTTRPAIHSPTRLTIDSASSSPVSEPGQQAPRKKRQPRGAAGISSKRPSGSGAGQVQDEVMPLPVCALAEQELVGGETVFYGGRGQVLARVAPEPGLALLHLHGEECLEHEALLVKSGTKYVLRSDVVFG